MKYSEAVPRQFAVSEVPAFTWHQHEDDLVNWWIQQAEQMKTLITTEGERIVVLDAGERNDGPGPDILRARILLDDREVDGSVEMHRSARDWYGHGHHTDPAYEDVILHVVENGAAGPNLPTLQVERSWLGGGVCSAVGKIQGDELWLLAYQRLLRKKQHIQRLASNKAGYDPLMLGMIEVIQNGTRRRIKLHETALMIGLQFWPDLKPWEGSRQTYPVRPNKAVLASTILDQGALFDRAHWGSVGQCSWAQWTKRLKGLTDLGISRSRIREWLVNILAPYRNLEWAWEFWVSMPKFRHYGIEKRLLPRLGLSEISTIAEQQGLLGWNNRYCRFHNCTKCPLRQSHNTFTQFN